MLWKDFWYLKFVLYFLLIYFQYFWLVEPDGVKRFLLGRQLIVVPLGFLVAQITSFDRYPAYNFSQAFYFFTISLGLPGQWLHYFFNFLFFLLLCFIFYFALFSFLFLSFFLFFSFFALFYYCLSIFIGPHSFINMILQVSIKSHP